MILGLDISSTNIGLVVLDQTSTTVYFKGTMVLERGDPPLLERIRRASEWASQVLATLQQRAVIIDLVAIEAPALRTFPLSMVAQQRVIGAVLAVMTKAGLRVVEVAPKTGKLALAGSGSADKYAMMQCARMIIGRECTEHEADALGIALGSGSPVGKPKPKKKKTA